MKNKPALTRKKLLKSNVFWLEYMRNQIFREVQNYLSTTRTSRKELADNLGYSRGYISQILNGNSNLSFEKLTELSVAIGKAPYLYLKDLEDVIHLDSEGRSIFLDFEDLERKADRCELLEGEREDNLSVSQEDQYTFIFHSSSKKRDMFESNKSEFSNAA